MVRLNMPLQRRASRRARLGLRMDNGKSSAGFFLPGFERQGHEGGAADQLRLSDFMVDTSHLPSWLFD